MTGQKGFEGGGKHAVKENKSFIYFTHQKRERNDCTVSTEGLLQLSIREMNGLKQADYRCEQSTNIYHEAGSQWEKTPTQRMFCFWYHSELLQKKHLSNVSHRHQKSSTLYATSDLHPGDKFCPP